MLCWPPRRTVHETSARRARIAFMLSEDWYLAITLQQVAWLTRHLTFARECRRTLTQASCKEIRQARRCSAQSSTDLNTCAARTRLHVCAVVHTWVSIKGRKSTQENFSDVYTHQACSVFVWNSGCWYGRREFDQI